MEEVVVQTRRQHEIRRKQVSLQSENLHVQITRVSSIPEMKSNVTKRSKSIVHGSIKSQPSSLLKKYPEHHSTVKLVRGRSRRVIHTGPSSELLPTSQSIYLTVSQTGSNRDISKSRIDSKNKSLSNNIEQNSNIHSDFDTNITRLPEVSSNSIKRQYRVDKCPNKWKCCGLVCSPLCGLLSVLGILLMLGLMIALLVTLLNPQKTTTTSTMALTTTSTCPPISMGITSSSVCGTSCLIETTWISSSTCNLLARWEFENNYADSIFQYNGTASNNPTFVTGFIGQAVSFHSSLYQFIFTSYIPLATTSFSIDAWIYPTGFVNVFDESIVGLCSSYSSDYCLHITIRNVSSNHYLHFGFLNDDINSVTSISTNRWFHTAFIFDATTQTQTIFQDGILQQNHTANSALLAVSTNFYIGNNPNLITGSNLFQGYIDHLSINNRVKSPCEILEEATLAARFPFDNTLADFGPNSASSTASGYSYVTGHNQQQAVSFNGSSSSYFQASGFYYLGVVNQPYSFSLWVLPKSLSGDILHVSSNAIGTGWCVDFIGFTTSGLLVAQLFDGTFPAVTGPALSLSTFSHIVVTWSSTNGLRLYVNNVLISSMPSATTFSASSSPVTYITLGGCLNGCTGSCGHGSVNTAGPFNGAIDDLRVFSRELTSADVCALYNYS